MSLTGWRYARHVLFFVPVLGGLRIIKGITGGVTEANKLRRADDQAKSYQVPEIFIAAARVERAVCACRTAFRVFCNSIVHVFSGYVASLSINS